MKVHTRLQNNIKNLEIKDEYLRCLIKCSDCDCDKFIIYEHVFYETNPDNEINKFIKKHPMLSYEISRDKNNRLYFRGTIFDIPITKKMFFDEGSNNINSHIVVKACCSNCKKEVIIFDNFIDGYDALTENKIKPMEKNLHFEKMNNTPQNINLEIYNYNTFEEFKSNTGLKNLEDYYNGFGAIKVILVDPKTHKKK